MNPVVLKLAVRRLQAGFSIGSLVSQGFRVAGVGVRDFLQTPTQGIAA